MRIILVDDSEDYRLLLTRRIRGVMPDAEIESYDPVSCGRPGPEFNWGNYDVLILDYQLGVDNGLDWLLEFKNDPLFPATVILTGQGDEATAVRAMKLGAHDYLRKMDLTPDSLLESLNNAVASNTCTMETIIFNPDEDMTQLPTEVPGVIIAAASVLQAQIDTNQINIGPYKIGGILGKGGMGMVYQATRLEDGHEVAIKFLEYSSDQDERLVGRFIEEFSLIVTLSHPHLIKIYEQGFTDHYGFIIMELLTGGDLKNHIYGKGISDHHEAIDYIKDIALALQELHKAGIIHRDIKPANIMFRENNELVLTDFGTAKSLSSDVELTTHGEVVGTPYYMSPEQIQDHLIDERSDLYSLGVVFYEALMKNRPFTARSATALMYKHLHTKPADITSVPASINAIAQKMLEKNPNDRYANTHELLEALDAI